MSSVEGVYRNEKQVIWVRIAEKEKLIRNILETDRHIMECDRESRYNIELDDVEKTLL